jgi:methionyl aminopeptidase
MANIKLKNAEDVKNLREGGKRLAEIMRKLSDHVKAGISTEELDTLYHDMVIAGGDKNSLLNYMPFGAEYPFPRSICISINDEIVHGIPSPDVIIKEGDLVKLDSCLTHNGMIVDHAVTIPVGDITDEEKELLEVTKRARAAGIKAAKAGNYISDISKAIEKAINNGGNHNYGIVKILSGHGVGFKVHEEPFVPNYYDGTRGIRLEEGLVIAIEPMVNLGTDDAELCADGYTFVTADGLKSAHFEHTVLVTRDGGEILTA